MKKQSRLSSAIWMILTIAVISFGLYKAVESQMPADPQQGQQNAHAR